MVFLIKPQKAIKVFKDFGNGLEWACTLNTYEEYTEIADTLEEAKKKFRTRMGLKTVRNLTFEEAKLKDGLDNLRDCDRVLVFYNKKLVFIWDDNAHHDYPEDLVWDRDISGIFYAGVELGQKIVKGEVDAIKKTY